MNEIFKLIFGRQEVHKNMLFNEIGENPNSEHVEMVTMEE